MRNHILLTFCAESASSEPRTIGNLRVNLTVDSEDALIDALAAMKTGYPQPYERLFETMVREFRDDLLAAAKRVEQEHREDVAGLKADAQRNPDLAGGILQEADLSQKVVDQMAEVIGALEKQNPGVASTGA